MLLPEIKYNGDKLNFVCGAQKRKVKSYKIIHSLQCVLLELCRNYLSV